MQLGTSATRRVVIFQNRELCVLRGKHAVEPVSLTAAWLKANAKDQNPGRFGQQHGQGQGKKGSGNQNGH